jgi:hypothetical protein
MGLVIGMDEAGYGPNLGPLVVTVTAWGVPGSPRDADFWGAFSDAVCLAPKRGDGRLHVADSKQVYRSGAGLGALERGVLAALGLLDFWPSGFQGLCGWLCRDASLDVEPWFDGSDVSLPCADSVVRGDLESAAARWRDCCRSCDIALKGVRSDVVLTRRFNRLTRDSGSKGVALSRISLQLLREVWDPDSDEPVLIIADKHGGRNRYDDLLAEVVDGRIIFRIEEGANLSRYKVGSMEIRFQPKAEEHLPVALASMVSKYLRELSMVMFNDYWRGHVPDIKPTQGYPVDARRFRGEIAAAQALLGLDDDALWREK